MSILTISMANDVYVDSSLPACMNTIQGGWLFVFVAILFRIVVNIFWPMDVPGTPFVSFLKHHYQALSVDQALGIFVLASSKVFHEAFDQFALPTWVCAF